MPPSIDRRREEGNRDDLTSLRVGAQEVAGLRVEEIRDQDGEQLLADMRVYESSSIRMLSQRRREIGALRHDDPRERGIRLLAPRPAPPRVVQG
jgi:hypothetical protein